MTEKRIYAYPGMDSHSEILDKAGIKDTNLNPDFVKVEFIPRKFEDMEFDKWKFAVDQDYVPDWFIEKIEKKRLVKFLEDHPEFCGSVKKIDSYGTTRCTKMGVTHCEDGPAVIRADGRKEYWVGGKQHREDGPAVIGSDGYKEYWVDGKLHREGGPAVIRADGWEEYRVDGKRHREDGPAVIWADGYNAYWVDGKRHREDGPAVIGPDGYKEYWVDGKRKEN